MPLRTPISASGSKCPGSLCDTEGAVYVLLESDRGGKRKVICLERQDDYLLNVYK